MSEHITPGGSNYRLLRDEVVKIAGKDHGRLLVYRVQTPFPIPEEGVALFAIKKGYLIKSITSCATDPLTNDADFILTDRADGEVIGVVEVRAGKRGTFPMAVPKLPADLHGPCRVHIQPREGVQDHDGEMVFQIAVSGPLTGSDGLSLDLDGDGIPDDVGENVVPLPPFVPSETFDDFMIGYNSGILGSNI